MFNKLKFLGKKEPVQREQELILWPGGENSSDVTQTEDAVNPEKDEVIISHCNIPTNPKAIPGNALIWMIHSAGCGSGATTLATNLASVLALSDPERVLLIDLKDGMGSVRGRMGLVESLESILDWQNIREVNQMMRAIVTHSNGVCVVPGVPHYEQVQQVTPALLFNMLSIAKDRFEHIVLDCPSISMSNITPAAALVSDIIITVMKPDRVCLDNMKNHLAFLDALGCKDRSCVVLNQEGMAKGLRTSELLESKKVGFNVFHTLPYTESVIECNNQRVMVTRTKPKDDFSVEVNNLIKKLQGGGPNDIR